MNYIQYMKPGGATENKKETSKFIEWLNKAGKSWKDFWDKPVIIQYAYNPHAVVGNGGAPFSSTQRRGDFATQAAGALAVPATATGVATVGVVPTLVGMGTGMGAGIAADIGGAKLAELAGGDENALEMVGDIAGFTLGALAGGKATKATTNYLNFWNSWLNPKSVYTTMAEALTPVKTSSAGIWTNRGTRAAQISEAERLGIPKGERNAYLIGTNADPSYYAAIGLNNSHYTQRLRDFHFDLSFPRIERTTVHHGNMIPDNMMLLRGLSPYFDGGRLFGYFSSSSYPIAKTYNFVDGASTYSLYPIIKKPYVLQANGRNGIEVATNKYNLVVKTDQVVKQAFDAGHDGVIIKNVVDIGPVRANLKNASEVADDIITLPGKAKMADAVTYDDLYQIIPLSQRDNILIHDIRYKQGGSIKIKKKNRGKFTDYCGGKVTEECIRKGKNSSNPTTRKRANFAANARKWKHQDGGIINYLNMF